MPSRLAYSRRRNRSARTCCAGSVPLRLRYSSLPSSMPKSVTMPVMWVVRITDDDILLTVAFCKPIMKDSSSTVAGTANGVRQWSVAAPISPNTSINSATRSSGSA